MKQSLATLVFLFSGSVLADEFPGNFYKDLATTGANITVDALYDNAGRLAYRGNLEEEQRKSYH